MSARKLEARIERRKLAEAFILSRGVKTEAVTVTAEIADGAHRGRGECTPYKRYDETPEQVLARIEALHELVAEGLDRRQLQRALPPGAARNALDCALWDLEAKQSSRPAYALAGLPMPQPHVTAYTISLGSPMEMGEAARKAAHRPLLKIKLGGAEDHACLAAVRGAAPASSLIVDANEGWAPENIALHFAACAKAGVALIEQPLPAGQDEALAGMPHPIPVCADESAHDSATLPALRGRYDAVNIKLDKCGGLTEALKTMALAKEMGFRIMIGCMVASSLAMAPAMLLAGGADWIDLDGPLLLAHDRAGGLRYDGAVVHPPMPDLWG